MYRFATATRRDLMPAVGPSMLKAMISHAKAPDPSCPYLFKPAQVFRRGFTYRTPSH